MKILSARRLPRSALAALALTLLSRHAAAAGAGGITEWETPLQKVVQSITGPVAFSISVIGIVVAGAMLIWGGEINEFARKLIMVVLVIALIVTATNLLSTLFGTGAGELMAQLRTTAMQRALNRPNLFLGGERELVLTSGLLCFGLSVSSVNLLTTVVGLILWFVIIALLRMMAKADPMMSRVYLRQLRYRLHYAPRSRPHRQE